MKTELTTAKERARTRAASDEGAAMLTALLVIMITATFSIVMLGVILSQLTPTQLVEASTKTVFAAESGINAAVAQMRNAEGTADVLGNVYGDTTQLPCTVTGTVDSGTGAVSYSAEVTYFQSDPTGQDDTWRATHAISCADGSGPAKDPTYALITSTGEGYSASTGDLERTLEVVYEFMVTNTNIPGGYIYSWEEGMAFDNFCLQADSVAAGSKIRYVNATDCGSDDDTQLWLWDGDYRLVLAATTLPTYTGDQLCITYSASSYSDVYLDTCKAEGSGSEWNQLWSWTGGKTWQAQKNPRSSGYANYWLGSGVGDGGIVAGSTTLKVVTSNGNATEERSFNPDPGLGAAAAGYETHQIVNYLEFGRCADVTGEQIGASWMISYPCKQDPASTSGYDNLAWNHKWWYTEPTDKVGELGPQVVKVYPDSTGYCLQSAGTEGGYVVFQRCSGATNQNWTRVANTQDYDTSWLFKDAYGRCLDLTVTSGSWSRLVTNTCTSGTLSQKWNAPAKEITASLGGYWEFAGETG